MKSQVTNRLWPSAQPWGMDQSNYQEYREEEQAAADFPYFDYLENKNHWQNARRWYLDNELCQQVSCS